MAREKFATLTEQMYYILLALLQECCGVDIMEKVSQMTGSRITVGPGTLYTLLGQFQKEQIIVETLVEGRRKSYRITQKGLDILTEEYHRLKRQVADGEGLLEL
jgi:DNA-binding PadR family transcriptional regulator